MIIYTDSKRDLGVGIIYNLMLIYRVILLQLKKLKYQWYEKYVQNFKTTRTH